MRSFAQKLLRQKLFETLRTLPPRSREVLSMRYGLDGGRPKSLTEVSTYFNISRERIRQIESGAIAKLRDPSTIKMFEDYFSGETLLCVWLMHAAPPMPTAVS